MCVCVFCFWSLENLRDAGPDKARWGLLGAEAKGWMAQPDSSVAEKGGAELHPLISWQSQRRGEG